MFKNKHLILAMLISPVLAIIAYFGVDLAVSEKPQAAKEGESYKLAARSNCRYTSGLCSLENGDFKVKLRSEGVENDKVVLILTSDYTLEGAKISMVQTPDQSSTPVDMHANSQDGTEWTIGLPAPQSESSEIRLVVSSSGTVYFGDTPTTFVEYKTLFTEEEEAQQ